MGVSGFVSLLNVSSIEWSLKTTSLYIMKEENLFNLLSYKYLITGKCELYLHLTRGKL